MMRRILAAAALLAVLGPLCPARAGWETPCNSWMVSPLDLCANQDETITGAWTFSGATTFTGAVSFSTFTVSSITAANFTVTGNLSVGGTSTLSDTVSAPKGIASSTETISGTLTANGNIVLGAGSTNTVTVNGTLSSSIIGTAQIINSTIALVDLNTTDIDTRYLTTGTAQTISAAKTFSNTSSVYYGDGSNLTGTSSVDGWTSSTHTWTYISTSAFSTNGDVTGIIYPNDVIKYTQSSTVKYGWVTAVAFGPQTSTVTATFLSGTNIANAGISTPFYSHQESPVGLSAKLRHPTAVMTLTGNLTITSGVDMNILFDSATVDTHAWVNVSTGVVVPKVPGLYLVAIGVEVDSLLATHKILVIASKNKGYTRYVGQNVLGAASDAVASGSALIRCDGVTDNLGLMISYVGAATKTVPGGDARFNYMVVTLVTPEF